MLRGKSKTREKITDAEINETVVEGMRERRGIRPAIRRQSAETLRLERRETVQLRQVPKLKAQFSADTFVYKKPPANAALY